MEKIELINFLNYTRSK